MSRDEGYKVCQRAAAKCWDEGVSFREALEQDPAVTSRLTAGELGECFDLEHHLRNVGAILRRLGL